jgi:hypothetical protein
MLRFGPVVIGALLMTAVLVNASDYSFLVPLREVRIAAHRDVVMHVAPAPERYRLLIPLALDLPIRAVATVMPYDKAFGRVYAAFYFFALTSMLAMLVYELSQWFTLEQALVGALLVGSTIRIALRQGEYLDLSSIPLTGVFAPHSLLEPIFVAVTIVLSLRDRRWPIAAVVLAAMLNSEAGVFLPFVYLAVRGASASSAKAAFVYVMICITAAVAIRLAVGVTPATASSGQLFGENVAHLPTALVNIALFMGPLWVLAALGLKTAPDVVRRLSWLVPIYLIGVAVAGLWWDVRLLMGLYPLLIPMVLSALFTPRVRALEAA